MSEFYKTKLSECVHEENELITLHGELYKESWEYKKMVIRRAFVTMLEEFKPWSFCERIVSFMVRTLNYMSK